MCREPAENLAENLKRDFETMWWTACREVMHSGSVRTVHSFGT